MVYVQNIDPILLSPYHERDSVLNLADLFFSFRSQLDILYLILTYFLQGSREATFSITVFYSPDDANLFSRCLSNSADEANRNQSED